MGSMEDTQALQTALVAVTKKVGALAFDAKNDHHGYGYASAKHVLNQVREACIEEGIAITYTDVQLVKYENDIATVKITQTYTKGRVSATFSGLGSGKDKQDKAVMKASTAALKYLLAGAFNISWGDDPEATDPETGKRTAGAGKKTSKKRSSKKASTKAAPSVTVADIEAAADLAALEALKSSVREQKGEPCYADLKNAFVARRTTLSAPADD